ncbi:RNA-binding protein [Haloimpatiens sp. FM7315]|uniref:YlmH family RNA-binding protein n=1 Tax=Haloimpatiens sp. FM7315 TaxID=3298609 RepID=UPI00370C65DC
MGKKNFTDKTYGENEAVVSNIYDKIQRAYLTNSIVFTNEFCSPKISSVAKNLCSKIGVNFCAYGVFQDAERCMLSFSLCEVENSKYPIDFLKISVKSKFCSLDHKDFLGSIMSLGIKREKYGDLILENDSCYVPVSIDISDYVKSNLLKIKRESCSIKSIDILEDYVPNFKFQDILVIVTSDRLDSFVASICKISRNKSADFIKSGNVQLNYSEIYEKDFKVSENDILTIRRYGKYKIYSFLGYTQKDRIKILIKKFA